jgi:hypothetical protein
MSRLAMIELVTKLFEEMTLRRDSVVKHEEPYYV